jgi:hypothetical protein
MAEHGLRSAAQESRDPSPFAREFAAADRVHASVHYMQPASRDPVVDCLGGEAEREQLRARDHPMLRPDQPPNRRVIC